MTTAGERIRQEREAQGLSRPDLARFAGIAPTTLSDLELGRSKGTTALHKIAARLGVRAEWLETGKGAKEAAAPVVDEEWSDVKGYAQAVGLGRGAEAQEYAETHSLKFRSSSFARKGLRPEKLAVMYGDGDSMVPRVHPGDAILFDTGDTRVVDGALYVIQKHGRGNSEVYVKRALVLDDTVFFAADNPAGDHSWRKPKRMDSPKEPIQVLGRVRWIGSWED